MTTKLITKIEESSLVWLCLMIFFAAYILQSNGQSSDENYCVSSGYLYRAVPGINDGQGICQFTDNTWCDAQAFATGQCKVNYYGFSNPYGLYYPYSYFYGVPYAELTPGDAIDSCTNNGGKVESLHTPYGDVDVCSFPDGRIVDLYGHYNGVLGDYWPYYAYSWLNTP